MQAAMLTDELSGIKSLDEFMLLDAMPLALGVKIDGTNTSTMIRRNITIPTRKTRTFSTSRDNQSVISIQLLEGEDDDNHTIGKIEMDGISPKPRGESKIEVTVDVDANGCLTMLAVDESTGKSKKLTVNGGLPASEIERMRKGVMKDTPKMELEKFANSIQSSADERIAELKRSIEEMQAVRDQAATTLNWLSRNRSADREAIYVKKRKLEEAATSATHKR